MKIWLEQIPPHIQLVGVHGRLDQTLTPQLEDTLNKLLDEEKYQIIVDLDGVNYINSGGLRCLVSAWRLSRQHGGNLVLTGLSSRLQEIFGMVGFDKVFNIYPTREEAQSALTGHQDNQ